MVWGVQRLNAKKSQPNGNIVFIKPISGPDEQIAQDFLERIAAQCSPIMKEHHLYVLSLEEFPANNEFVGRNFNAGEVIQLVLRSPRTGRWLPFEYVQMVMMHELAHCKQMNHSRAFWAVRNGYARQMHELFKRGYTGEGLWGRGRGLSSGEFERNAVLADEVLPEHLCGGTYRSRGRKQKRPVLSYQERKRRRIEKKFGKHGTALGADDAVKTELERGKKVKGKPRVAGSARGRELRAAAALARFDKQRAEPEEEENLRIKGEGEDADTGSESEYDDYAGEVDSKDAVDVDGSRLVDEKGRGMIKVCEDEHQDDPDAKDELSELSDMLRNIKRESPEPAVFQVPLASSSANAAQAKRRRRDEPAKETETISGPAPKKPRAATKKREGILEGSRATETETPASAEKGMACAMCSFINSPSDAVCSICANVLRPDATAGSWKCASASCKGSGYVNSKDRGVCGICQARKP
ncbi:hypothetical protein N3K66_002383 [Trichothecium roseum]|uniref:Uncharacterized protein n=1 Tax=Trichothecium roseum TaxID=47278 RepID=A0ACC0V9G4_9HYPO|nr:hypothetical protein N3K66_002383 [Trichothecium roseum]